MVDLMWVVRDRQKKKRWQNHSQISDLSKWLLGYAVYQDRSKFGGKKLSCFLDMLSLRFLQDTK